MLTSERTDVAGGRNRSGNLQARANAFAGVAARTAGILSHAALAILLASQPLRAQRTAAPRHDAGPSVVGFWAGEDAATPDGGRKQTSPETYYEPAYRGDFTQEVWRVLQEERVPIYFNVRYGRDFGPLREGVHSDATELVRKANSLGVPVIAWVVVPYEQGYWAYQGNAPAMLDAVKAWTEWKKAKHLVFESVAIDQEFSWQNLQSFIAGVTSKDPNKLTFWMRTNIDPAAQCKAFHEYQDLISGAHVHGIRVDAAEAPMVTDDLEDGTMALQNALQITGSSPGYDEAYLMAYRSASAQAGFDPGSAYAASYFSAVKKYFGGVGEVSIGIPGQKPYDALGPLVNDVRMLAGLGGKHIPIYSLEEMVTAFGADGIKKLAEAAKQPMQGAELAEATKATPTLEHMFASTKSQDATASELTITVTKEQGHPQTPNRWPDGCGDLSAHPLVTAK
jgi:hypothetical protein